MIGLVACKFLTNINYYKFLPRKENFFHIKDFHSYYRNLLEEVNKKYYDFAKILGGNFWPDLYDLGLMYIIYRTKALNHPALEEFYTYLKTVDDVYWGFGRNPSSLEIYIPPYETDEVFIDSDVEYPEFHLPCTGYYHAEYENDILTVPYNTYYVVDPLDCTEDVLELNLLTVYYRRILYVLIRLNYMFFKTGNILYAHAPLMKVERLGDSFLNDLIIRKTSLKTKYGNIPLKIFNWKRFRLKYYKNIPQYRKKELDDSRFRSLK